MNRLVEKPYMLITLPALEDGKVLSTEEVKMQVQGLIDSDALKEQYGWSPGHIKSRAALVLRIDTGEKVCCVLCGGCSSCSKANKIGDGPGETCGFLVLEKLMGAKIEWVARGDITSVEVDL